MSYEHPSVYIATYSNTDVYECLVGDAPIMRRCKDDWVNATQILKLCDFPKAKRTKILEKGVQQGQHEKVQGGYGRFQGTWIPLKTAQELAEEYELSAETIPVLYIDVNDPNVTFSRKSKTATLLKEGTPSKRKYVRRTELKESITPKKMKHDNHLPPQAVFTQDYTHVVPRTASNVLQMANGNLHMPHMGMPPHIPSGQTHPEYMSNDAMSGAGVAYQRTSNYPHYVVPDPSFSHGGQPPQHPHPQSQSQSQPHPHQLPPHQLQPQQQQSQVPVSYNKRSYAPGMEDMLHQQMMYQQRQKAPLSHTTNETNWSQEEHTRDLDTSISSGDPKAANMSMDEDNSYVAQLLRFFSEDNAPIPYFLYNPPADFNINEAIDDEGHSALHWAASVGNLNLVHLLLSKGANPLVVSNLGLNPLSKCIAFNNCYDLKNFPLIVDALDVCLINTDINGRTPLHYLCQFSKVASKLPALSYYIDVIFKKLRVMSHNSGTGVDLIKNVVDHQDVNGDTCLHLASRAGCTQLIKFFLGNGARDDLLDVNNQTAKSIIMQLDLVVYNFDQNSAMKVPQHMEHAPESLKQAYRHQQQVQQMQQVQQGHQGHQGHQDHQQMAMVNTARDPKPIANGLGTPIRGFGRLAETPDTQRTTIQDDEIDELNDHVSKEHLKSLLERQAGTVEEDKENVFVDDHAKTPYGVMSTPKQSTFAPQMPSQTVLGVISERANEGAHHSSPARAHSPCPPRLDKSGRLVDERSTEESKDAANLDKIKLPMKDVSHMVSGMMHSLLTSYEEQLSGLRNEQSRVKSELKDKKIQDKTCARRSKALLDRSGLKAANTLEDMAGEVSKETERFSVELHQKEGQLQRFLAKLHAYELASMVEQHEKSIETLDQDNSLKSTLEKMALAVELTQAQIKRAKLANKLAERIRDFAINSKMNKYRKLISLSCGLKVEDIDGLIDGIELSLSEGSAQT